ncbi:MAG TPA: hypothetical protein VFW45_01815 [Candidatus Polarisedimenticolia bacterium]|nr:hypothetical protein [Candidatus Polarisedimenticolia bacterium]
MTRTCDDILERAAAGDASVESLPEFIEHLKICARCGREAPVLLAAVRAIRAAPAAALEGHPPSDQIVALALAPEAGMLEVDPGAAEHVAACAICAAEVKEVRRAEEVRSRLRAPAPLGLGRVLGNLANLPSGPVMRRLAWVAGLGILVLAYPAYLGLRRVPQLRGEVEQLDTRTRQLEAEVRDLSSSLARAIQAADLLTHWSGPVPLIALSSPVRGQATRQTLKLDPTAPYILVSVRPILSDPSDERDIYRVLILRGDGQAVWNSQITAGEMRRTMRSSGALIFPVPSTLLAPGGHELRVLPEKRPQEPILQIPFEIVTAD